MAVPWAANDGGEGDVAGPTAGQIEHYVRMLAQLHDLSSDLGETLCWTVVRAHGVRLTVDEVVRRLRGEVDATTAYRPAEVDHDPDTVFVQQRGDAVLIVGYAAIGADEDIIRRLSQGATVHGVFWVINNFNRLYHHVDGTLVTELDVLRPLERWGAEPDALGDHLDALRDLSAASMSGAVQGPAPDWETAMATVESLTGLRLDADWFNHPQPLVRVNHR